METGANRIINKGIQAWESIVYPDQLGKVKAHQVLVGGVLHAEDHAPIKCRIARK